MAVKKKLPYKAAVVACNGGCRTHNGLPTCSYGCMSCRACIEACKFQAITYNEYGVAQVNEADCIGCGICEKIRTAGAIKVTENHAVIDEPYCLSCGMCAVKCPRGQSITSEGFCGLRNSKIPCEKKHDSKGHGSHKKQLKILPAHPCKNPEKSDRQFINLKFHFWDSGEPYQDFQ